MDDAQTQLSHAARAILLQHETPLSLERIASEMISANGQVPPLGLECGEFCTLLLSILEGSCGAEAQAQNHYDILIPFCRFPDGDFGLEEWGQQQQSNNGFNNDPRQPLPAHDSTPPENNYDEEVKVLKTVIEFMSEVRPASRRGAAALNEAAATDNGRNIQQQQQQQQQQAGIAVVQELCAALSSRNPSRKLPRVMGRLEARAGQEAEERHHQHEGAVVDFCLGFMRLRGVGQEGGALPNQAIPLFERAARMGFPPAMQSLATCLANGQGCAKDTCRALCLLTQAACEGFKPALDPLSALLMHVPI